MKKIALAIAILLLPLASLPARSRSATGPAGATASAPRASDAEIEQKIHAKLAKSKIGKDGISAHVKGGVVTWEGHTTVPQHKGAATRMAKSAGAVRVVNNIQVSDLNKPARRAQVVTEPQSTAEPRP